MARKPNKSVLNRLLGTKKFVPVPDLARFMSDSLSAYRDIRIIDRDIAETEARTVRAVETIRAQHASLRLAMSYVFSERQQVIEKHFDVVDAALATNDRELLIYALRGLGEVVASSPFADIEAFARALNSGDDIKL
jgi:hypothetical protein